MRLTNVYGYWKISFPEEQVAKGTIRLTLWVKATLFQTAAINQTSTNLGIYIAPDCNKIKTDFDDREFFALSGRMNYKFIDMDDNIVRMFLHPAFTYKDTKIVFEFKPIGSTTFATEFEGHMLDGSFETGETGGYKYCSCSFVPQTNILNETPTFINGAFNPVLGPNYTLAADCIRSVKAVVTQIYKLVNPNINVTFFQNWQFRQFVSSGAPGYWVTNDFDNLYVLFRGYLVNPDLSPNGKLTYMDVLKFIAQDLGCYTGMIDQNNAYFGIYLTQENLSTNYVEISSKKIIEVKPKQTERVIKYLELKPIGSTATAPTYIGNVTGLDRDKLSLDISRDIYRLWDGSANIWVAVGQLKNPTIDWLSRDLFKATYWSAYYLQDTAQRRDRLSFFGVDIPLSKTIKINDRVYRWLELTKNYDDDKCLAIGFPVDPGAVPPTAEAVEVDPPIYETDPFIVDAEGFSDSLDGSDFNFLTLQSNRLVEGLIIIIQNKFDEFSTLLIKDSNNNIIVGTNDTDITKESNYFIPLYKTYSENVQLSFSLNATSSDNSGLIKIYVKYFS